MKKLSLTVLALIIVTSGAAAVSAGKVTEFPVVTEKKESHHFHHMKNFEEQVHKANELKIKRLEIKKEIVQKKDKLFDLHMKAAENGEKNKRSEAKTTRQDMKKLHQDLKALRKEAHETRKSMHKAMKAKDEKLASEKMTQWLSINEKINSKLAEKSAMLDEIIAKYN